MCCGPEPSTLSVFYDHCKTLCWAVGTANLNATMFKRIYLYSVWRWLHCRLKFPQSKNIYVYICKHSSIKLTRETLQGLLQLRRPQTPLGRSGSMEESLYPKALEYVLRTSFSDKKRRNCNMNTPILERCSQLHAIYWSRDSVIPSGFSSCPCISWHPSGPYS